MSCHWTLQAFSVWGWLWTGELGWETRRKLVGSPNTISMTVPIARGSVICGYKWKEKGEKGKLEIESQIDTMIPHPSNEVYASHPPLHPLPCIYKQAQASERTNVTLAFKFSTDGSRIKRSAAVKPHMLPSDQPRMGRKLALVFRG